MEMKNFILHGDILSVEVKIDTIDYRFAINGRHLKSDMEIRGY